jgi:hypothetical protein
MYPRWNAWPSEEKLPVSDRVAPMTIGDLLLLLVLLLLLLLLHAARKAVVIETAAAIDKNRAGRGLIRGSSFQLMVTRRMAR